MIESFRNIFRVPELRKRLFFTFALLAIYRVGCYIVTPGIDPVALREFFQAAEGTIFGFVNTFTGGGLARAAIFALGIMPYISASIIFQLLTAVFPYFEKLQKEGEEGRKKITQYTRYSTVGLSAVQAYGYAIFLQNFSPDAILFPGIRFIMMTILVLTTGAVFVMWLGEQITERGVGNGMSLLIFFSIIEGFPATIGRTWESFTLGEISAFALVALLAIIVLVSGGVVAMTMAARKIPVQIEQKDNKKIESKAA